MTIPGKKITEVTLYGEGAKERFQSRLRELGYEIEIDNPIFDELFPLYLHGTLYYVYHQEFGATIVWQKEAEALLAPYYKLNPM